MLLVQKYNLVKFIQIFLMITLCLVTKTTEAGKERGARCEKPDYLANGSYRLRRERVMRITCNSGYQLQGSKTIDCVRGKWEGEKPVCAKKGCTKDFDQPDNGHIQIENELKAILYCSNNYILAGNRHSYCNGTHWDRPIGNCREHKNKVQLECDFESDDICGWTYEPFEGLEWKRVMAANVFTSFKTGPRHDHTTLTANGGHYMLMESLTRKNDDVTLTSPIYDRSLSLKTSCCFQFYYFMYGAGVGDLFVIVKPVSLSLNDLLKNRKDLIKFQKYGNQNNIWNKAHFNIEELEEDFQILFVAKSGRGQLSDIAIDDVKLLTGDDCRVLDSKEDEESSNEEYDSTTYESIFEIQSCAGRCFDSADTGVIRSSGHLKGLCSCDVDCEDNETCCPDFRSICLSELFLQSTIIPQDDTTQKRKEAVINYISSTEPTTITTTTKTIPTTTTKATTVTTPMTIKTTLTTVKATTTATTPTTTTKTTTTSTTPRPTTIKITPTTTRKTTTTTVKTTPTTTTTKTTPTTTTRKTSPTTTTTQRTTPSTTITTRKITTKTTAKATTSTQITRATTTTANNSKADKSTKRPIPTSKPIEYIMNPKKEAAHRGSSLLLCTFVIIVVIIISGAVYRKFGDKAVAWYMIRFNRNNSGDDVCTSITTTSKRPPVNAGNTITYAKTNRQNKGKKFSRSHDIQKTPLVNNDDDEDDDFNANGNIPLKNNIYTEL